MFVCKNKNVFSRNFTRGKVKVLPEKYLFNFYRSNAKRRNLLFTLCFEDFLNLIKQKCAYCLREPYNLYCRNSRPFLYNGIDRVNNNIGYIPENVVPCCKNCNKIKGALDKEVFLDTVNRVRTHLQKQSFMMEDDLILWRKSLAPQTLVVCSGVFDVLHIGHVTLLNYAKQFGDFLLVGLDDDESVRRLKGPTRPINTGRVRQKILSYLSMIDATYIYKNTQEFLNLIKPDVWVKGSDYSLETLNTQERDTVLDNGGRIEFAPKVDGVSSTAILKALNG